MLIWLLMLAFVHRSDEQQARSDDQSLAMGRQGEALVVTSINCSDLQPGQYPFCIIPVLLSLQVLVVH
jgi:hypothetical protein